MKFTFQFTTSRGGRQSQYRKACRDYPFNSRPHEEVDFNNIEAVGTKVFQFTTSRGGRHRLIPFVCQFLILSIHDLTRRSTGNCGASSATGYLSIHDLTRRSTFLSIRFWAMAYFFQFTTSRGGRQYRRNMAGIQDNLSIHDLTRRSTFEQPSTKTVFYLSIHDLTRRSTLDERSYGE